MHAASTVLGTHIAPTAFFQALGQATLQTVSFSNLSFTAPDPEHITLSMQGVAQSVNSIALQAELFSKNGVITNPLFSNIARQPDGVHFDLTAAVNPVALNYESFMNAASAGAASLSPQGTSGAQTTPTPQSPFGGALQSASSSAQSPQGTTPAPGNTSGK